LKVGFVCREAVDERGEVVSGEAPVEGFGDLVPAAFEVVEGAGNVSEVVGVVRLEHLALDDRVVDLDLVEPAGVSRLPEEPVRPALSPPGRDICVGLLAKLTRGRASDLAESSIVDGLAGRPARPTGTE
jgi:hypothetical protein